MDLWNLPGGGVESGELSTEAAIRETREETGLDVEIERLVGVYGKEDKDELVFAYLCRVTGGQLSSTDEADACTYFGLDEIPPNTSPKQVERIHDAQRGDDRPAYRIQTGPSSRQHLRALQRQGNTTLVELLAKKEIHIRDMQAFHTALDEEKGFDRDMLRNVAYLVSELGEAVHATRQFLRASGQPDERAARDQLGQELADCLAYLLKLANYADIDLQSAYVSKMRRNVDRTWPTQPEGERS